MADNEVYLQWGHLVGQKMRANTETRTAQEVTVEVTAIRWADHVGVAVWGYRQYPQRAQRARKSAFPQRYWIPNSLLAKYPAGVK